MIIISYCVQADQRLCAERGVQHVRCHDNKLVRGIGKGERGGRDDERTGRGVNSNG